MSPDAGPGIRFCDEYEHLMSEFLRTLSTWAQFRCFHETPPLSTDQPAPVNQPFAEVELARSRGSYAATLWALRLHSRSCLLCAETLRIVNGEAMGPSTFRTTNCC